MYWPRLPVAEFMLQLITYSRSVGVSHDAKPKPPRLSQKIIQYAVLYAQQLATALAARGRIAAAVYDSYTHTRLTTLFPGLPG